MEYRTFGGTGMQVSKLCLGAMMFGPMGNADEGDCVRIVHRALDAGINFVDTADACSRGESERIVARALAGRRDGVVLATKCFIPMGSDPNMSGGSRRWIVRAVDDSLRRLGTDWIDLYQLHRRDYRADLEEPLAALTDLQRQGKIRVLGMSASPPNVLVEAHWIAERRALAKVRGEQCLYSVMSRGVEEFVLPTCQQLGIGVLTYGPLNGGWLSGKYRRGEAPPEGSRATGLLGRTGRWDDVRPEVQRKYEVVEALAVVAREAGLPLTHLATAFAAAHPAVSSVIIGPRTLEQLEDSLAAADVKLPGDVLDRIDAVVPPGTNLDPRDTNVPNPGLDDAARRRRGAPAG
jgi:aryl-alcohol dehydrogenase (NADP+)